MAGALLRTSAGGQSEQLLLRTGLEEFNIAKITVDDQPIFKRLIADLFPGLDMIDKVNTTLVKQVRTAASELGYQSENGEEGFVLKVIQTKDILVVRHCMFIIGPPGSGKSAVWKCLAKQETNAGNETAA
jgi:dynein heavy chain